MLRLNAYEAKNSKQTSERDCLLYFEVGYLNKIKRYSSDAGILVQYLEERI